MSGSEEDAPLTYPGKDLWGLKGPTGGGTDAVLIGCRRFDGRWMESISFTTACQSVTSIASPAPAEPGCSSCRSGLLRCEGGEPRVATRRPAGDGEASYADTSADVIPDVGGVTLGG